ncbi:rhodanese-like domain-containing protein [Gaetbulibacter sp. M240]|uniref:rhodanese-like domain-containing protein n=1 Tax=Gaetbulibacter sp. M240 TaxID=3126511 RepID=UPI00374F5B99
MNQLQTKVSNKVVAQIPANQVEAILKAQSHHIIDVRNPQAIENQGGFPGAVNIPLETVDQAIDKSNANYHPVFDNEGPFLFCCTGGVMSYMAAIKAQESGIKQVFNLEGGHAGWLKVKTGQEA